MSRVALTVVTPSFNQGRFISRTIESVLTQDVQDLEYLVYDAVSTDETPAVLAQYADTGRLSATIERDRGQSDAINKGLAAAHGEVVGWLNSDDVYYPGACRAVLDVFAARSDVDVVYANANHIDEDDRIIERYNTEPFDYERLKDVCFLCQPAVFLRKRVIDRYGPLDVTLRYCMDYEYWLRILVDQPPYFLERTVAGSRLHAETKTLGSKEAVHREILDMLCQKFGTPPARWVHNLAHVIVRERGFTRETPEAERAFVAALLGETEAAFERYSGGVPATEVATLAAWREFVKEAVWK
jgi:glycosyltransferase involved in cell wall biosynthesis